MRRSALLTAAGFLLTAAPLAAQSTEKQPPRPKLEAGADTNDPRAYYDHGRAKVQKRPREAADAFYWASRLAPEWADPLYGRWAALHLSQSPQRRMDYFAGKRHVVEAADIQRIDSLLYRAYLLNPFMHRPLDRMMIEQLMSVDEWFFFQQELDRAAQRDPVTGAWVASTAGRYREALKYYGAAIRRYPKALGLRSERARAYFLLSMHDSAVVDLTTLISQMRERDEKKVVYVYQSKAMYEHSIGTIWLNRGQLDSARTAFERALVEDLSFYSAHASLAALALAQGDTATAASEFDLAVQLNPSHAPLRYQYALVLIAQSKSAEGLEQLQRATELEPYFSDPYFAMARLLDYSGFATEAMDAYGKFASHAPRRDADRRAFAIARHAELQAESAATGSGPALAQPTTTTP